MFAVTLMGNVAANPERRGAATAFRVGVSQGFGEKRRTAYWRCVAFGNVGVRVLEQWKKGDPIVINGRVEEDVWTDKQGVEQRSTSIVANDVYFVPRAYGDRKPQQAAPIEAAPGDDIPF